MKKISIFLLISIISVSLFPPLVFGLGLVRNSPDSYTGLEYYDFNSQWDLKSSQEMKYSFTFNEPLGDYISFCSFFTPKYAPRFQALPSSRMGNYLFNSLKSQQFWILHSNNFWVNLQNLLAQDNRNPVFLEYFAELFLLC